MTRAARQEVLRVKLHSMNVYTVLSNLESISRTQFTSIRSVALLIWFGVSGLQLHDSRRIVFCMFRDTMRQSR